MRAVICRSDEALAEEALTSPAESDERLREEANRANPVSGARQWN